MKKLLFLSLIILFSFSSIAGHFLGGEITWKCLTDGKYQFFMTFYRDCSGIPWRYQNEIINITASRLPKDATGSEISSIIVKADSVRFDSSRKGSSATRVTTQYGSEIPCASLGTAEGNGNIQQFFYKSEPIVLDGVPPKGGWKFSGQYSLHPCCRGYFTNVATSVSGNTNAVLLRAFMYPTKNKENVNPCLYSSVEFAEGPTPIFCRGERVVYQNQSSSPEGDFLSYSLARAENPPADNPNEVPFLSGYSVNNPTPDESFDSRNRPSVLNEYTGEVDFEIHNGVGLTRYLNVFQIDSWKEGVKVSSAFREYPITIFDCPVLPNGKDNNPPKIYINGKQSNEIQLSVLAGDSISIPIEFIDKDESGSVNPKQQLTSTANGSQFSKTFKDSTDCAKPPCAFFTTNKPEFDSLFNKKVIRKRDTLATVFNWKTDCSHQGKDSTAKTYYFNLLTQDDHAPVPSWNNARIVITVNSGKTSSRSVSLFENECISVKQKNGEDYFQLNWENSPVQNGGFESLVVHGSNQPNSGFQPLDTFTNALTNSYFDTNHLASALRYYFIEKEVEGCDGKKVKIRSDTIYPFSLELIEKNDQIRLEWNGISNSSSDNQIEYVIYKNQVAIDTVFDQNFYVDQKVECNTDYDYYVQIENYSGSCITKTENESIKTTEKAFSAEIVRVSQNTLMAKDSGATYAWYNCNLNRLVRVKAFNPKPVNRIFSPSDTGTYAVIVTKDGCKDTSDCIPMYTVGIEETPFQNQFSYFPNPTNNNITISSNWTYQNLTVTVRTITGQLVSKKQFANQNQIELAIEGEAGIYFIQLSNESGERVNFKIVKNNF